MINIFVNIKATGVVGRDNHYDEDSFVLPIRCSEQIALDYYKPGLILNMGHWTDAEGHEHNEDLMVVTSAEIFYQKDIFRIDPDGSMTATASYSDKFAAIYALALYVAQHIRHCDYKNKLLMDKIRQRITVGRTLRTCFYEEGDTLFSCCSRQGQTVYDGETSSKYEYTPNIPK